MEKKQYPKPIGAVWIKQGQYGDYLSISLEINGVKQSYVAYANKFYEQGSNKPQYNIQPPKVQSNDSNQINKHQSNIDFVNAEKARIAKARASDPSLSYNQPATITQEDIPF